MRYAILSDIHGNAQALEGVVNAALKCEPHAFLCVGDTVGYGADPHRCLNALKRLKAVHIAGNHDWAVIGRLDAGYFTEEGKIAIEWTRNHISFEDITYLSSFEISYKNDDLILVHATLHQPSAFHYLNDVEKCQKTFELMDRRLCFIGHTHVPGIFIQKGGKVYYAENAAVEIDPSCQYIVNVGSVGQPRDKNPLSSYCIYDTHTRMIAIHRVSYDIPSAQNAIISAGLPAKLATRLSTGD